VKVAEAPAIEFVLIDPVFEILNELIVPALM
jgi:hypothetical protein